MHRLRQLALYAALGVSFGMLVYGLVLWRVMVRNMRGTDLPIFTMANFEDSWLKALVIVMMAAFACWGAYMYDKAGDGESQDP